MLDRTHARTHECTLACRAIRLIVGVGGTAITATTRTATTRTATTRTVCLHARTHGHMHADMWRTCMHARARAFALVTTRIPTYIVMVCIVVAYIVIAYTILAYTVPAQVLTHTAIPRIYTYGVYSCGVYRYGL